MGWTWDLVINALGDEAQIVPGGVIKHHTDAETGRQSNVLIAELLNGVVSVTPEGLDILGEAPRALAVSAPRKRRTKAEIAAAQAALAAEAAAAEDPVGDNLELDLDVSGLEFSDDDA